MQENREAIIVTGATGGIGSAIINALLTQEPHTTIIGACRRPERLPTGVEGLSLDLSNPASVRKAADHISDSGYRIKALINNAGIMPLRETVILPQGTEQTLEVNCLATVRFTELLLPMMIDGGAIVFTTSVTRHLVNLRRDFRESAAASRCAVTRFMNYGRTKLMLSHYALDLSEKLRPRGIRVNCADPGVVDTGIIHLGYRIVDTLADRFFRPLISTPAQGAEAALRAADSAMTASIFTKRKMTAIPRKWAGTGIHRDVIQAITEQ